MLELGSALDHAPRILITRLSAIGDCIHCTPLVAALRERYPSAFIGWVTQGGPASLLDGHPDIDALIKVDRRWLKSPRSILQVRNQLRTHRFDIAIDPQSLTKSSLLGWLSGATYRTGFSRGQARELSPWLNNYLIEPRSTHVVDRYLELLTPLGIESPNVEFSIPRSTESQQTVDTFLVRNQLQEFVLLNPGAGWNSKIWPHERYVEVAKQLNNKLGIASIVLWAGDRERAWAEDIASQSPAILAPDTTLPDLAELCRRATFFVGSDTGPMHLAAAVGTRCVAMFGPTKIEVCGPYGEGHRPLQEFLQDGTSKERRGDDNTAMRAISVESVVSACESLCANRAA